MTEQTSKAATSRHVQCPACGKSVAWSTDNPDRPFCSKRCKTIDFGAWAAEEYRIPQQETSPDLDELDAPLQ